MSSPRSTPYIEYLYNELIRRGRVIIDDIDSPSFRTLCNNRNLQTQCIAHKKERSQNQRRTHIRSYIYML